ncbi:MAG: CYTH domain-containing protein [bacterium]|nr:CYTH domain-containing protein [bacterium]MDZ4299897.1 CYTH domain-containing protein [Candidatus Sungbacteria bacterium]
MKTEFEATFYPILKDEMHARLVHVGALLIRPEFLQTRTVFNLPPERGIVGGWLRVRDEGDRVTLSLKMIDGTGIAGQRELQLVVNSFADAEELLVMLGCTKKSYQESRRELWRLDGADIMIDEWPFLEPFVEIEGESEELVRNGAERLGFDYGTAIFDSVTALYAQKYNLTADRINNHTSRIVFDMENPFHTL